MGVLNFFKRYLIDIVSKRGIQILEQFEERPTSVIFDANGMLYDVAGDIYALNEKTLTGKFTNKERIIEKYNTELGKMELFLAFSQKIKEYLTKLLIERVRPTDLLIIALDGKAFRAKQKQQRGRRFKTVHTAGFNTGEFTVGTEMMENCCRIISDWIDENRRNLPPYVYFSPCGEDGEAEHKIFRIFERSIERIQEEYAKLDGYSYAEISVSGYFENTKHVVIGSDSDLFFLSILRDNYDFMWFKDAKKVFDLEPTKRTKRNEDRDPIRQRIEMVRIRNVSDFIIEQMGGARSTSARIQCLRDFVLMAFLIGDDFVPGNFCMDLHVGRTLSKMCEIYANIRARKGIFQMTMEKFVRVDDQTLKDVEINFLAFSEFVSELKDLEVEMFMQKCEIQLHMNDERWMAEKKKQLDLKPGFEFVESSFLDMNYAKFLKRWKKTAVMPNYRNLEDSQLEHVKMLTLWDVEHDELCRSFMLGLQWNLSCYCGFEKLNDWAYSWCLAPTIYHLYECLENFLQTSTAKENAVTIKHHISGHNIPDPASTILLTLFNIKKQRRFINREVFGKKTEKTQNTDVNLSTSKAKLFEVYSPESFENFYEGRFMDSSVELYGDTPLLPVVPMQIQNKLKEIKKVELRLGENKRYGEMGDFTLHSTKMSEMKKEILGIVEHSIKKKKSKKNFEERDDEDEEQEEDLIGNEERRENREKRRNRGERRDREGRGNREEREEREEKREESKPVRKSERQESRGIKLKSKQEAAKEIADKTKIKK